MTDNKQQSNDNYGAESITVLEGLDPVRKRPGMYIGNTGAAGLHHLVWEVVDNCIDECLGGYANNVVITLMPNDYVKVEDDGRGIPTAVHSVTGISALETVLTKLHAGGKFGGGGYKVSGGLHGVGVSVVNALSVHLKAEIHREGKFWTQEYNQGKPLGPIQESGKSKRTGTIITFKPDAEIFKETTDLKWSKIVDRMRQQAYLTRGITITIIDERKSYPSQYRFYFEGGIKSYIRSLNHGKTVKNESIFYAEKVIGDNTIEISLQYNDEYNEVALPFANNIYNPGGGMHLIGFKTALTRTLNSYARSKGLLKEKEENLTGEDVREGLTAIISVKIPEPQFEGQTKDKLGNTEIKTQSDQVMGEMFGIFLEEHPKDAEHIIAKCTLAAQARLAARAARSAILRKGALEGMTLPGKLADCSSRRAEECELYIVEGDSAGGCFSGETKIALADGRNISFKDLIREQGDGKVNYCYTIKKDGAIGLEQILNPRMTKKSATVLKVVLNNDEEVTCTHDHKFMLADKTFKVAKDLTTTDSLMPLYKKYSKIEGRITIEGYEMIFNNKDKKWIFTHLLSDKYNLEKNVYKVSDGAHRHHKDFNKKNNNPDNLIRITAEAHLDIHRKHANKTLGRKDVKEKLKALHQTQEFRDKIRKKMTEPAMSQMLSERAKKQWGDLNYKKFMTEKYLEYYYSNEDYRRENCQRLLKEQGKYWSKKENREKQSLKVKTFFQLHPEKCCEYSFNSKKQWNNAELINWRSDKTKQQWTKEFRAKRRIAYDKTYLNKSLSLLKTIQEKTGSVDVQIYNDLRREKNDKSILKIETICQRFFNNDFNKLKDAVLHFNHKIKNITYLKDKIDVYDLEVPNTHNFALASGVFVHNSAKQGRDRKFQAILPLRGKILNVERSRLDKMLANNEIKNLVIAMGTNIDDQFNLEKLRYHRIIIMTDADVDGAHIRTLLLTLFFRHFSHIISGGHLYVAQPPLYRLQKGASVEYAYSDEARNDIITKWMPAGASELPTDDEQDGEEVKEIKKGGVKINIQRYKGLGEMNPSQLWETTMDPKTRLMKRITAEDAALANATFEMLMGDDAQARKHFIQTHATNVTNLDV